MVVWWCSIEAVMYLVFQTWTAPDRTPLQTRFVATPAGLVATKSR
jgi:hypothetical protein